LPEGFLVTVQYIRSLVNPASLAAGVRKYFVQGLPEAECAVADSKLRSCWQGPLISDPEAVATRTARFHEIRPLWPQAPFRHRRLRPRSPEGIVYHPCERCSKRHRPKNRHIVCPTDCAFAIAHILAARPFLSLLIVGADKPWCIFADQCSQGIAKIARGTPFRYSQGSNCSILLVLRRYGGKMAEVKSYSFRCIWMPIPYSRNADGDRSDPGLNLSFWQIAISDNPLKAHLVS
jgi:hypothetical protein